VGVDLKCEYLPDIPVTAKVSEQSREEWLAQRSTGIGGSDAAAILGISPWTSGWALWKEKIGEAPPVAETDAMRRGTETEPMIRKAFAAVTGFEVVTTDYSYRHPEIPWMLANLDGLVLDDFTGKPRAILEIKNSHNARGWRDGVPDYYVSQVQHYMAVVNIDLAYVCVLLDDHELQWFEVPADPAYQSALIAQEGLFHDLIVNKIEPEVDGTDLEMLRKVYKAEVGKAKEIEPDVLAAVEDRQRIAAEIKALKAQQEECEALIMRALEDAEIGTFDGKEVVSWKQQASRRFDSKAFGDAHPDLLDQFKAESVTRVLRFKAVK